MICCTNASGSAVDGGDNDIDTAAASHVSHFLLYAFSAGFSSRLMSLPFYNPWDEFLNPIKN